MTRVAYVDESHSSASAHYLVAAVVVDRDSTDTLRSRTAGVPRKSRAAFHWHTALDGTRAEMIDHVARSTDLQLVVACRPVAAGREERARALCLGELLTRLDGMEPSVDHVTLESRTKVLDKRDAARIDGLRASMRLAPRLRFEFATKGEPLLWLPDAVAGAVTADIGGNGRFVEKLVPSLIRVMLPAIP